MTALLIVLSLAGIPSAPARKAAREIVKAFGREAVERAEPRVARLVEALGDDAVRALRAAGPAGVSMLERYGAAGARLLSRWGDDGARLLASEGDEAVKLVAKLGDEAAEFMIRHPGVGRELLEEFGEQALRAKVTTEGARLLARMAEPIRASGRTGRIFDVVERFGDRACAFLWRNKGTVFGTAALVAFLSDPQPYIEGVKRLVVDPALVLAKEAVSGTDWTVAVLAAIGLAFLARLLRRPRVTKVTV
jgi:hypothetical protein